MSDCMNIWAMSVVSKTVYQTFLPAPKVNNRHTSSVKAFFSPKILNFKEIYLWCGFTTTFYRQWTLSLLTFFLPFYLLFQELMLAVDSLLSTFLFYFSGKHMRSIEEREGHLFKWFLNTRVTSCFAERSLSLFFLFLIFENAPLFRCLRKT